MLDVLATSRSRWHFSWLTSGIMSREACMVVQVAHCTTVSGQRVGVKSWPSSVCQAANLMDHFHPEEVLFSKLHKGSMTNSSPYNIPNSNLKPFLRLGLLLFFRISNEIKYQDTRRQRSAQIPIIPSTNDSLSKTQISGHYPQDSDPEVQAGAQEPAFFKRHSSWVCCTYFVRPKHYNFGGPFIYSVVVVLFRCEILVFTWGLWLVVQSIQASLWFIFTFWVFELFVH